MPNTEVPGVDQSLLGTFGHVRLEMMALESEVDGSQQRGRRCDWKNLACAGEMHRRSCPFGNLYRVGSVRIGSAEYFHYLLRKFLREGGWDELGRAGIDIYTLLYMK